MFWTAGPGLGVGHPLDLDRHVAAWHRRWRRHRCISGALIAYAGIPSFIVTLGGLIVWRGAAWAVIRGETVAPMDKNFKLIGGGFAGTTPGSIGATASWALGFIACAAVIAGILNGRRQRQRFKFPLRPVWAEITLAAVGCVVALGAPAGQLLSLAQRAWSTVMSWRMPSPLPPEGLFISATATPCRF